MCIGHLHSPPFSGSLELLVLSLPAVWPLFMAINNILSLISTACAHGSWTTCLVGVSWKNKDYSLSCQLPVANKGGVLGAPPRTVIEFVEACSGNPSDCRLCVQHSGHIQKSAFHSFLMFSGSYILSVLLWSSLSLEWWETDLGGLTTAGRSVFSALGTLTNLEPLN